MAYIGRRPDEVFRAQAGHDTFTGDGSTTTFDLSFDAPDNDADLAVFVDNVRQEPGSSKSYTIGADGSGNIRRITFVVAPAASAEIYVINPGRDTSLIDVADAAVTTAKLGGDAVTGDKLADDAVNSEHITDGSVDNVHLAGSIANAKLANSSITINGTSIALGASGEIVAGTDWQALTVADGSTTLTAEAGKGYFLDTNRGVIEVFLPTSPSRGDTIILVDYAGTFATNNVIVNTGTINLDSTTTRQYKLSTNDTIAEFIFVDSAKGYITRINQAAGTTPSGAFTDGTYDTDATYIAATGGTVTTDGNFKVHTFTGDGNFIVSSVGNAAGSNSVSYVVVAGGGGGGSSPSPGSSDSSGGGGAGGFREGRVASPHYTASPLVATGLSVTATTFPITVGGGGSGGATANSSGTAGSNSVFSTITSTGGGLGKHNGGPGSRTGGNGGSGGGPSGGGTGMSGGVGNTPPVSPAQGTPGSAHSGSPDVYGGGGGGATQAATDNPGNSGVNAGAGATTEITGSPVAYAGGGGGGFNDSARGSGGTGGGGNGGDAGGAGQAGTANTGGGGGGGGSAAALGGAGGKGVVIIRYKFQG